MTNQATVDTEASRSKHQWISSRPLYSWLSLYFCHSHFSSTVKLKQTYIVHMKHQDNLDKPFPYATHHDLTPIGQDSPLYTIFSSMFQIKKRFRIYNISSYKTIITALYHENQSQDYKKKKTLETHRYKMNVMLILFKTIKNLFKI